MSTDRANNGRLLGATGFLGFLGFLAFTGTRYSEWTGLAWLSLLSLISLGVFIPFDKARVKVPVNPRRKGCLGYLAFLSFLAWLGTPSPDTAIWAGLAMLAALSTQPDGAPDKPTPSPEGVVGQCPLRP